MWYCIIGTDTADSLDKRKTARPAHLERLQALYQQDRLHLAGAFPAVDDADPGAAGFTGSAIVAQFDDLAAAQAWADADPYLAAGVYESVTVKPINIALP